MIKNMLFPYDREEYLNRFVSAAVYTCLHRVGDYMKQARNDASGLYLKKAMAEHKQLVKLVGEIRIEARKPQPEGSNERKPNVVFSSHGKKKIDFISMRIFCVLRNKNGTKRA